MVSKYPEIHQLPSSRIPQSASYSYFPEQANRAGYVGPQLGRTQHAHVGDHLHQQKPHPHPQNHVFPPPQSHEMHDLIHKEIEKERMREMIIMSEIARMRAEERRMMEMELSLRRGSNNGLIPSVMGSDSQWAPLLRTRFDRG